MDNEPQGYVQTRFGWIEFFHRANGPEPLVYVNGGPGGTMTWENTGNLNSRFSEYYYNQGGCGLSYQNDDLTLDHYVDELEDVIDGLGLDGIVLFGHSWGAAVAVEYAWRHRGDGIVKCLVLGSPFISASKWNEDQRILMAQMSGGESSALSRYLATGDADDEFYRAYSNYLSIHYGFGADESLECAREKPSDVYLRMWGPNELQCTGILSDLDLTDRLEEIDMKVLVFCGSNDSVRSRTAAEFASMFPNGQFMLVYGCGHSMEPGKQSVVVNSFLDSL